MVLNQLILDMQVIKSIGLSEFRWGSQSHRPEAGWRDCRSDLQDHALHHP